jgi:hypothetical protein
MAKSAFQCFYNLAFLYSAKPPVSDSAFNWPTKFENLIKTSYNYFDFYFKDFWSFYIYFACFSIFCEKVLAC